MNKPNATKGGKSGVALRKAPGLKIKKILAPIDFSPLSRAALQEAVRLAEQKNARLSVIHVVGLPQIFGDATRSPYAEWNEQYLASAKSQLERLVANDVPRSLKPKVAVRTGRDWSEIIKEAETDGTDLIVMGTQGLGGIKRVILGSTAEKVVRHAPCSVLVVHQQRKAKTTSTTLKKILVPTDFSEQSGLSAKAAGDWARNSGAAIQLLHVVPIHYALGEYDGIDYRNLEAEQEKIGRQKLADLAKRFPDGVKVNAYLTRGRAATEIREFARKQKSDLIVISTHGHTGFQHVLLGSTTEEVVRNTGCPVLVVRNPK